MNQKKAELKAALSKRKSEICEKRAVERHNRGRECGKILRLRSRDVPCERADSDLSGSDSELDSDASGSDQFDLEIDMVDQPFRGAQSPPPAIINERLKKKRKNDNTKRSPLPEKRKRRRRVVIDDDESEKEEPDDPDAISTINVIDPLENHSVATPALTPNSYYPESLEDSIHERVAQEIGPIKAADMEESSNWSLKASVSDLDNKSESSEIDVVGIDEKISVTPAKLEPLVEAHQETLEQKLGNPLTEVIVPKVEQIVAINQASPVIEKQIVAKKSRKRLADELLVYAIVESSTLMTDFFVKSLVAQHIPREDDNPILPNTMQVRIAGRVARERLYAFGLMAQLDDLKEQRRLLPAPREFFTLLSPSRKTCRFCGEDTHFTDSCLYFRTLAEREEEVEMRGLCRGCLIKGCNYGDACSPICYYCKNSSNEVPDRLFQPHHSALCPLPEKSQEVDDQICELEMILDRSR